MTQRGAKSAHLIFRVDEPLRQATDALNDPELVCNAHDPGVQRLGPDVAAEGPARFRDAPRIGDGGVGTRVGPDPPGRLERHLEAHP